MAVLCLGHDNTDVGGAGPAVLSIADTKLNTWTVRQAIVNDPGAADQGVIGEIWTSAQNGGALTTGDSITVTYAGSPTQGGHCLFSIAGAGTPTYVGGGAETAAGPTTPTITTASIPVGDAVIGFITREGADAPSAYNPGDSGNGTWSTAQEAHLGSGNTGHQLHAQYKVQTTGASTQVYDATVQARDSCELWVSVNDVVAASSSLILTGKKRRWRNLIAL